LFQSLLTADENGSLEDDIFVLEIGVGLGLFARYFLDAFQDRCAAAGKDYYERLHYVGGDYSGRMLLDACLHGVFENHPGRYLLRSVNALDPAADLGRDPLLGQLERPFRAVFLNYLLDCLPATVLKISGQPSAVSDQQEVKELFVRTCVARGVNLGEYTDLRPEELVEKAGSRNAGDKQELLHLFGLLATEYAFQPADLNAIPYGSFALDFARSSGCASVWQSYEAIQSLERLLPLVREDGFILVNDYGHTDPRAGDDFEHQRMSRSTFIGINFPQLKSYFGDSGKCQWAQPEEDTGSIYARLLNQRPAARTVECFRSLFSKEAHDERQEAVDVARACLQGGAFEAAVTAYQKALERQPRNWLLMSEIAKFLTFTLRAPESGLAMARAALELNPACSADLWNTYGDSLFVLGRHAEARQAFQRALRINPNDARAWYNLSFVYTQEKDHAAAMDAIGKGMLLDGAGEFREGFLQKQSEILAYVANRHKQELQLQANRLNRYPAGLARRRKAEK